MVKFELILWAVTCSPLECWIKKKKKKKHFACDLAPNTHGDNKLDLSISSSTDHWDANTAGGWGDEGLCVLWSAREEEGHQVSMLSRASQLLARWIPLFTSGSSYYNSVSLAAVAFIVSYSTESCQKVFTTPCDIKLCWYTTPLFKKKTGCDQRVKLHWLSFELCPSASFVGRCTWRTFQNRSYLARWEKCVQELTDLTDAVGQYLEIFLYSVKNMVWGQTAHTRKLTGSLKNCSNVDGVYISC